MRKLHCTSINRALNENTKQFIKRSEANYRFQIEAIANSIADHRKEKPIVLLSGPSGAGKTTSALRLEEYLDERHITTHTISMDNYFLPAHNNHAARDENGEIDFESPYRLDIDLLNDHMIKLANCEEITLPVFNFANQNRKLGKTLKRESDHLIVFEGIHALNPEVTGLTTSFASCIYVSIRTRLQAKTGGILHPNYIRLMRRLIRDKSFRARDTLSTIAMFENVGRGENKYIMPYKNRAEYSVDTFIPYELSIYKKFLYDDLLKVQEDCSEFENFDLMIEILNELNEIPFELVPENSLVREFTGGSKFKY